MLVRQLGVSRSDAGLRLLQVVFQLCCSSGGTWKKLAFFSLKEARLVRERGSGKWVQRQCHLQDTYSNVSTTGRRLCPETHGSSHAAVSGHSQLPRSVAFLPFNKPSSHCLE